MDLKVTVDGLEKERDFYFGKLRDIELLCQENEGGNPVLTKIMGVLYATEVTGPQITLHKSWQDSVLYFSRFMCIHSK